MTSKIRRNRGFTLVEVLLAVSLLAVAMAGILGGYREILGNYGKARLQMDGLALLEEKMTDSELAIKSGRDPSSSQSGTEGVWSWSVKTVPASAAGFYEIKGEVSGRGRSGVLTLFKTVRE